MLEAGIIVKRYIDGSEISNEDTTSAEIASKIGYDVEVPGSGAPVLFQNVAPHVNVRWPDEVPGTEEPFWTFPYKVGTPVIVATFINGARQDTYIIGAREEPYYATCESLEGGTP